MLPTIAILCIDDEPLFLDAFKTRLEQEPDLDVTIAQNPVEALDLLNQQFFDVIISDYSMPDMDGLALLKEIRARGGQSIFVVATAKRLAHIAKDALNTGADYYLQKGVDMASEVSRLIDFLRTRVPQKNAENEMVEWARLYNSIVDNGSELICRINPDGALTFVNEPFVHLFKEPYRLLVQENFFTYVPESEHLEILARIRALSPENPDCLLMHSILPGDGRQIVLEWGYHVFYSPEGEVQEYQLMGRDSGALIRIGQPDDGTKRDLPSAAAVPAPVAPVEKPGEWHDLLVTLQSLDVPVFAVDKSGVIIAWSTKIAELTGVSSEMMVGKGNHEYAVPFYGKPVPMLIDYVIQSPQSSGDQYLPAMKKTGDMYIGDMEEVTIRGRPMLLWGKCSPVYDASGQLIGAIEAIMTKDPVTKTVDSGSEDYLGGVSSPTLKISGEGVGGAIAGAIGSSGGGYGVYATTQRLFVIRNPDQDISAPEGVQLGTFLMDELFGTATDMREKPLGELENSRIFEAKKGEIEKIVLKKPVLLSGYMEIIKKDNTSFRMYVDHKKAYTHIENLMKMFAPDFVRYD
jgi:PAS domain S-box-containing protein